MRKPQSRNAAKGSSHTGVSEVREPRKRSGTGWTLDEASWRELEAAAAEADRGELVSSESVLAELRARAAR